MFCVPFSYIPLKNQQTEQLKIGATHPSGAKMSVEQREHHKKDIGNFLFHSEGDPFWCFCYRTSLCTRE